MAKLATILALLIGLSGCHGRSEADRFRQAVQGQWLWRAGHAFVVPKEFPENDTVLVVDGESFTLRTMSGRSSVVHGRLTIEPPSKPHEAGLEQDVAMQVGTRTVRTVWSVRGENFDTLWIGCGADEQQAPHAGWLWTRDIVQFQRHPPRPR
jgi:hypothetical protein